MHLSFTTTTTLIATLTGLGGFILAWLAYLAGQRWQRTARREAEAARVRQAQQEALNNALSPLIGRMDDFNRRIGEMTAAHRDLSDKVSDQDHTWSDVSARVSILWEKEMATAKSASRILHSPHPERYHIDRLLEKFDAMVDGEYEMTAEEKDQLREELEYIVSLPHGEAPRFPLFDGDKMSAASVLSVLDMMEAIRAWTPQPRPGR